ncbi:MAG TPA: polyphosphate kinase [Sphingomicrobium sp.]|nr:polyphosphate kinase [Sphingomicrobium sp.]
MPIDLTEYERGAPFSGDATEALKVLQDKLARLQLSQIVHRKRAIILFEGWMGAGKRAILKRLVGSLDPTHVRVIKVAGADKADDDRHWLALFWSSIPSAGDTTIFYRSWYRMIVEQRVLGNLDGKRWARAIDEINEFEAQQRDHGTMITKLFFHVTPERQAASLRARQEDPWLRHLREFQPIVGPANRDRLHDVFEDLFEHTNTRWAPWTVIDANDETAGCITALTAIADQMEKAMPADPPEMGETILHFPPPKASENNRA